jgi:hypothetical protein
MAKKGPRAEELVILPFLRAGPPLKAFKSKGGGNVDWLCILAPGAVNAHLGVNGLKDKRPALDKACRLAYI